MSAPLFLISEKPIRFTSRAAIHAMKSAAIVRAPVMGAHDAFYVRISKKEALELLRSGQFEVLRDGALAVLERLSSK